MHLSADLLLSAWQCIAGVLMYARVTNLLLLLLLCLHSDVGVFMAAFRHWYAYAHIHTLALECLCMMYACICWPSYSYACMAVHSLTLACLCLHSYIGLIMYVRIRLFADDYMLTYVYAHDEYAGMLTLACSCLHACVCLLMYQGTTGT